MDNSKPLKNNNKNTLLFYYQRTQRMLIHNYTTQNHLHMFQ